MEIEGKAIIKSIKAESEREAKGNSYCPGAVRYFCNIQSRCTECCYCCCRPPPYIYARDSLHSYCILCCAGWTESYRCYIRSAPSARMCARVCVIYVSSSSRGGENLGEPLLLLPIILAAFFCRRRGRRRSVIWREFLDEIELLASWSYGIRGGLGG